MSEQFIYGEPVYRQEVPYDTDNNNSNQIQGIDYGAYELSNFQQTASNVRTLPVIIYQEFEQQQFQDKNKLYNNQIFIRQGKEQGQGLGKIKQEYQIHQNGDVKEFGNNFQNQEQNINLPQTNIIYQQIPHSLPNSNVSQQQTKMASQVLSLNANAQTVFSSRNPHIKQQYQQQPQNISLNNQPNLIQLQIQREMQKENCMPNIIQNQPQIPKNIQKGNYIPNIIQNQSQIPKKIQKDNYMSNVIQNQPKFPKNTQKENYMPNIIQNQPQIQKNIQKENYMPNIIQNQPQIQKNIQKENFVFPKQNQNFDEDIPQIESDFQPNIPLANSIISQSKIPIELKPNQELPLNPQTQQMPIHSRVINQQQSQNYQKNYVIPRRNPNVKLSQYENIGNESHFVVAADPGSRTIPFKSNNNVNQNQSIQKPNISKKISEEKEEEKKYTLSKKSLEANFEPTKNDREFVDKLFNKKDEKKINIYATDGHSRNIAMSNMNDINNMAKSQAENNIEFSSVSNIENNIMESKLTNEEIDKENPIEEKKPDESNMDNVNDLKSDTQKKLNQNQPEISQRIDIDDNLDYLPTINDILKGDMGLLPPPKKKKYED